MPNKVRIVLYTFTENIKVACVNNNSMGDLRQFPNPFPTPALSFLPPPLGTLSPKTSIFLVVLGRLS